MQKLLLTLTALVIFSTCTSKKEEIEVQKNIYLYRATMDMDEACSFSAESYFLRGIFKASAEQSLVGLKTFMTEKFGEADTLGIRYDLSIQRHYSIPDTVCKDCFLEVKMGDNQFYASFFRKSDTTLLSEEQLFIALKKTFQEFLQENEIKAIEPLVRHGRYRLKDTTTYVQNSNREFKLSYTQQMDMLLKTDSVWIKDPSFPWVEIEINRKGNLQDVEIDYSEEFDEKFTTNLSVNSFPRLYFIEGNPKEVAYKVSLNLRDIFKTKYDYEKELLEIINSLNTDFRGYLRKTPVYGVEGFKYTFYDSLDNHRPIAFVEATYSDLIVLFKKGKKGWRVKQIIREEDIAEQSFELAREVEFIDLNEDGSLELLRTGIPNMNGNVWANIYSFSPDTISLVSEGFLNPIGIGEPVRMIMHDSSFKTEVSKFIATPHILGSWYMPVYNTLYSWDSKKLVKTCIYGTELFPKTMMGNEHEYFFIQELKNGKLVTTQQFPLITDADRKKAAALEIEILKKYVNATILEY